MTYAIRFTSKDKVNLKNHLASLLTLFGKIERMVKKLILFLSLSLYIYIYIYMCVCVCVTRLCIVGMFYYKEMGKLNNGKKVVTVKRIMLGVTRSEQALYYPDNKKWQLKNTATSKR